MIPTVTVMPTQMQTQTQRHKILVVTDTVVATQMQPQTHTRTKKKITGFCMKDTHATADTRTQDSVCMDETWPSKLPVP